MTPSTALGKREALKLDGQLLDKLASVLPKGYKFGIYHLSTPPTKTSALFSAPPGERQDKTYWENHFLAVSIDAEPSSSSSSGESRPSASQVLVLALEVFIFTTAFSSTIFVSKADSTGYLHLLGLPKGTPSPIREISSAFVSFLVEHRRRKDIRTVVSLFARAQSQYLFPGSVNNSGKHVLDDRGLVKWWCRVLNPLLENQGDGDTRRSKEQRWAGIKGYLIVPGLDHYETRAFLPRTPAATTNWKLGHPLERISHYTKEYDWVPPRCLIPRYPDDPKSRFRDELDEEAAKWKEDTGAWKSIKTLDQFWEMMAFRQECSSGRLTGFIWVVFDPPGEESGEFNPPLLTPSASFESSTPGFPPSTPPRRRTSAGTPQSSPLKLKSTPGSASSTPSKKVEEDKKKSKKKKLSGRIIPRQAHIKTHQRNYLLDQPISSTYYYWPHEGRGEQIVDETDYKRIVELLLHLDFSNLEKAKGSTTRWIGEVAMGGAKWGRELVGTKDISATAPSGGSGAAVNNLAGLIKRRRPTAETEASDQTSSGMSTEKPVVNVLGAGLVKRKRQDDDRLPVASNGSTAAPVTDAPPVNVLGAGLVRRKPKPT
jgi:regulator of Ty1 transposition protein 109